MSKYSLILITILTLGIVGSIWGYPVEYKEYDDITVVNLNHWIQPVGNVKLKFLIYNNSNGQVLANIPVSAKFGYWDNYKTLNITTDAYGVATFNVNLSEEREESNLQFVKIGNTSTSIDFWFRGIKYWSVDLGNNYIIAKNGTVNISIPISKLVNDKFPPIKISENGNITLYIDENPKTFPIDHGFIKIYLENITSPIEIWSSHYSNVNHLYIYPDTYSFKAKNVNLIPEWSEAYSGENVEMALIALDWYNKPIVNKTYTVQVVYDYNWDNITTFNITTNEYGLAEFNITANAEHWIEINVLDGDKHICWGGINIIQTTQTTTEPYLDIDDEKWVVAPNKIDTLTITFKNGTMPIPNVKIRLYSNGNYLGEITTDSNGKATYQFKSSKEGIFNIIALATYNGMLYGGCEEIYVGNKPDVDITENNGKLMINAKNCIYKVTKNPIRGYDDGLILDMGFNATNKEIDLGSNKYGYYKIVGYYLPYSSIDDEIAVIPFEVEKEDIKTITKYTNYPLTVTVKDKNGNPIKDALVIGDVELWKKSYNGWINKEYIKTAITDNTGKATLYIQTKDFDDGNIKIYVSNKTYLFKVDEDYFDIEGTPKTYIDLKGSLNYRILNETENSTTFEITLSITNNGNIDSGKFNTTIYANNKPIKTERLSLKAGESTTITATYTTNSTDDIEIKAIIDENNEVDEIDEDNNVILETIRFPDIGIAWAYIPTAVKINETKDLRIDIRKEGYGDVKANLTVKLDNKTIHDEIITFNDECYDWKYREIPITFNESGIHNITISITPIGTKDRNLVDNTKTITVSVKEAKADIEKVYGLPYNHVLKAGAEYWIDINYNVSIPDYYTVKINTTKGIQIIGDNEKTRYTWRYGWTYFRIKAFDVSNNESIMIGIYYNNKLLANTTISGIKITDNPVEMKYANISYTNTTTTLSFKVFNTTNYDIDRHIEYLIMVGEQGRVLKGIEYLAHYPHGCIEQTTSPMVASIYVKKYCNQNNITPNINFDDMVNRGIERLTTGTRKPKIISNDEYAWGLWGVWNPNPIHTAYVLYGLTNAKIEGYNVDMKYVENGARYIINNQDNDGSWNSKIYTPYYMRDRFSCNALITISLAQTYNLTTNDTLKQEISSAINKSVRYLISQDVSSLYDLGFKAWALAEAYKMGINDSEVKDALNETIRDIENWTKEHNDEKNVISLFRGTTSYSVYGVTSESIAVASIGCQKAKDIVNNDAYITLNNMLINIYNSYVGSGWGSTKSTGLALRALTESESITNANDIQITVKVDGITIDTITVNTTNPKFVGKYYNDSLLTSGEHKITFEFNGNTKILCGVLMSQKTPYSKAIESDGKDYIDPLAENFNLTITTTKAVIGREFNATFTITNNADEPIEVGILEIKLPDGMNYTNITKYLNLPYSVNFNSTTNETIIYIYPEIINASNSLEITIPLNITKETANNIEAVFYPMYNEETIAPAKAVITVIPVREINIKVPNGWKVNTEEKEDRTIITIG